NPPAPPRDRAVRTAPTPLPCAPAATAPANQAARRQGRPPRRPRRCAGAGLPAATIPRLPCLPLLYPALKVCQCTYTRAGTQPVHQVMSRPENRIILDTVSVITTPRRAP